MERTEQAAPDWFAAPQSRFRPAAYWFWHRLPSPDEMQAQLADFRDKGYRTILIQARLALPRSLYLSPIFLQTYAQAVAIMGELGLTAGLYDDYNWTSGQAGGRTVDGADHLRERHLFWATVETPVGVIDGIEAPFAAALGPDIADWLYDGGAPRFGDWQRISALLHPVDVPSPDLIQDVTDRVHVVETSEGCRFAYDGRIPREFRLTVFVSALCRTSRLINYLLPEAGKRFVQVGLEPYAEALGMLMPKPLEFLFFDQPGPGFYRWRQKTGNLGNSPLYAPLMAAAVETASGAAFGIVLLSLVMDVGPSTARLRCLFNVDKGWQVQGFADFSGVGFYHCTFHLDHDADIGLDLPSVATAVTVRIDGRDAGMRSFPPFRIALGRLSAGCHHLELAVSNTAANRYYAGTPYAGSLWPDESGLSAPPRLLFFEPYSVKE